jgi:hypothetical protein
MLLRPGIDVSWSDNLTTFVRIVLVLVISDLSFRFIEMPIRRGAILRFVSRWKKFGVPKPNNFQIAGFVTAFAILIASIIGMYRAPVPNADNLMGLGGITAVDQDPTAMPVPDAEAPEPTSDQLKNAANSLVVFGDSVVLSGLAPLQSTLGDIAIDAEVGRLPNEIAQRIEIRRKERRLGNDVVIHMGTNGVIARSDLEPILKELSDRHRVVVVNVKVPRKWMDESNNMINELVPLYPNVRLADWAATAKGHRGYFAPDGVHLTKTGGQVFAGLIKEVLDSP